MRDNDAPTVITRRTVFCLLVVDNYNVGSSPLRRYHSSLARDQERRLFNPINVFLVVVGRGMV